MAFNSATGRSEYTATAGQTVFPFVFKIFTDGDINVYQTALGQLPNEVTDLLTLGVHYTVSINGDNGGEITLIAPASLSDAITIARSLEVNRLIEYQNNGDLLAGSLNDDQDYQTYLISDQDEASDRAIRLNENSQNVSNALPAPEAGKFLRWNDAENALENDAGIQEQAWEAEAEALTSASYATEPEDVFVKLYTSNGDGTFSYTDSTDFSSFHWSLNTTFSKWVETPAVAEGQTVFTLVHTIGDASVYLNGALLEPTVEYTVAGNQLTLLEATTLDDTLLVQGGVISASTGSTVVYVETLTDLVALDGVSDPTAIVQDYLTGGTFTYDITLAAVNNGITIFDGWVRAYNGPINVTWAGAVGDGITDDSVAIQTAIDYVSSLANGGRVYFPSGEYLITSQGVISTRAYGLIIKDNVILTGESTLSTIIKAAAEQNMDVITTARLTATINVGIDNLTIDGNSPNNTNGQMNFWARNATDISVNKILFKDSGDWACRIDGCSQVFLGEVEVDNVEETNADGIHFVDTHDVVADKIRIFTAGDDAFIIQGESADSYNYSIGEIIVSAPAAIAPGRGVTFFSDVNVTSVERKVYNVSIGNIISYGCAGPAFNILGCTAYNINVTVTDNGSNNACALIAGTSLAVGNIYNSVFNVTSINSVSTPIYSSIVNGDVYENTLNTNVKFSGSSISGVSLVGSKLSGSLNVDAASSTGTVAVNLSCDNSMFNVVANGADKNIRLNSGASNNNISLGNISSGVTADIEIASGASSNTFIGGEVAKLTELDTTTRYSGVRGIEANFKLSADLSIAGDGSFTFPHTLAALPHSIIVSLSNSTVPFFLQVGARDATNITLHMFNQGGTPTVTGIYTIFVRACVNRT